MTYQIYTDGAYSPTRNQGGIGFIILKEDGTEVARFNKTFYKSTNQRMEQMAAIIALESFKEPSDIILYSDSAYVVKTYTDNWKRKCNHDLWDRLDKAISQHNNVTFKWVKGHADNKYNKIVDLLAQNASHYEIQKESRELEESPEMV